MGVAPDKLPPLAGATTFQVIDIIYFLLLRAKRKEVSINCFFEIYIKLWNKLPFEWV